MVKIFLNSDTDFVLKVTITDLSNCANMAKICPKGLSFFAFLIGQIFK